ncbi:MAG: hypothetical protein PUE71_00470 [Clostridia bacterium]|nr:hypothetical protein [Clostridia bacterium]
MYPSVLICRIVAYYAPLRGTSSKSVSCDGFVYIVQLHVLNEELCNCLLCKKAAPHKGWYR